MSLIYIIIGYSYNFRIHRQTVLRSHLFLFLLLSFVLVSQEDSPMEWDLDRSSAHERETCRVSLVTLVTGVAHCTVGRDARLEPAASENADSRRHRWDGTTTLTDVGFAEGRADGSAMEDSSLAGWWQRLPLKHLTVRPGIINQGLASNTKLIIKAK